MDTNEAARELVYEYVQAVLDEARLVHDPVSIARTLARLKVQAMEPTSTQGAGYVVLDNSGAPLDIFIHEGDLDEQYTMKAIRQCVKDNNSPFFSAHTDLLDLVEVPDGGADVEFTRASAEPASARYQGGGEPEPEMSYREKMKQLPSHEEIKADTDRLVETLFGPERGNDAPSRTKRMPESVRRKFIEEEEDQQRADEPELD
ncbi:hypothetical protein [Nesterenkonia alba]|uniref:hypothetical protein n=1 Tax=Nesterenkonia alba TaxID=515814 RepID=UPI0003B5E776|nr:hypothetical protein [Nesterenkonia alba]